MLFHLLHRLHVDQRPLHHAGFDAIAHFHGGNLRAQLLRKLVVNAFLHEKPVGADAGLSGIAELGRHRALDRGIDIGIVEHDKRRIAAELERDLLDGAGALRHQQFSDFGRAGEGEFAHDRIAGEFLADRARTTRHHGYHAIGNSSALGKFAQRERRIGRIGRRFDHHGAAGGQRRPGLARNHRVGKIPRRHRRADTDRLLDHDDTFIGLVLRYGIAVDALAFFGKPLDERSPIGNFDA
jgi:hypothetical protein